MGFLTDLVADLRRDLAAAPLDESALLARATVRTPARDLPAALRAIDRPPALIAEVKRASPSAGAILDGANPSVQACAYVEAGAAAVSVLTEPRHFHGSLIDLDAVRSAVEVPVLRKDFLIDPAQVIEARAHGADAILLIAATLGAAELEAMLATARDLGMEALVETHSDHDLEVALASGASMIGVNARDLETLGVHAKGALARLERIPADRLAVMESGISTRAHVEAALDAGASAILVGEALMRAPDPGAKVRELIGEEPQP